MKVGNVAHVDDAEADVGTHRHLALEQLFHDLDRRRQIVGQQRAEYRGGVYRGEFHVAALRRHPIARRALGDGFRARIGHDRRIIEVRPIGFAVDAAAVAMPIGDRRHRRGQNEAPHPCRPRETQRAQRAFARRNNQFIGVLGNPQRKGRSDMRDMTASGDRLRPAQIMLQIGREESEAIVVDGQPPAHFGLALQAAHRRVNRPAIVDQLPDQEAGNIAAAACYQYRACHSPLPRSIRARV